MKLPRTFSRISSQLICTWFCLVQLISNIFGSESGTTPWGFGSLEMFPIDPKIQMAKAVDINGDGLMDLVVSNPRKSEITLLLNRADSSLSNLNPIGLNQLNANELVNELPPDARFKKDSILIQSRPKALYVGDLDNDSLPEIIFYDDQDHLKILWNGGEVSWSEQMEWLLHGGLSGLESLLVVDLNMDDRPDVALLGEGWLAIVYNQGKRQFDSPKKIQIPAGVSAVDALDLNQDSRLDLALHVPNRKDGLYVSFRNELAFNAFMQISLPPMSKVKWWYEDTQKEILMAAISDHLEQVMVYAWDAEAQEDAPESGTGGSMHVIQFPDFSGIKRGVCWADLNADQQDDCLVSDPDAGLIQVFLSNAEGGWDQPKVFPSLTGIEELEVMDWDRNGISEIFMLSKDENQIGISQWDQTRQAMSYPQKLSGLTKPLVMTAQSTRPEQARQTLKVVHEWEQGWAISSIESDLKLRTQTFEGRLNGIPERLMAHDLDQDSLMDCLLFAPYEPLICLRQKENQHYESIELSPPGGSWQGGWANSGDLDSDGFADLILPFKNMVRAFKMESQSISPEGDAGSLEWSLKVVEQINGPSNTSHLMSAVFSDKLLQNEPSVALLDRTGTRLHMARRDPMGVWRVSESSELPVSDALGLEWLTGGGERAQNLLCQGKTGAIVKTFGGKLFQLKLLDSERSEAKEARLQSLIPVDFNGDGLVEIFCLETSEHSIECLRFESDRSLTKINQWSVFEKRSYRNQGAAFPEPKEGIVADFTGDGLLDLCLIVHDRIILYPQQVWSGTASGK